MLIAYLRVQGEFDKADAMLEITQEYLSQLMAMEQWAADYELTLEQLDISQKQWATAISPAIRS